MNKNIEISNALISFMLILGILPMINTMGFNLPIQYFLVPILLMLLVIILLSDIKLTNNIKLFMLLYVFIIIEVLISSIFGPLLIAGKFMFPREIILYLSKFLYFFIFIYIFFKYDIKCKAFMVLLIIVLSLGMGIGVIQFMNLGPVSDLFRELYSISDRNLEFMMRDNYEVRRVAGVAHFATANGGIAVFTFIIVLSYYLFYKRNYLLTIMGIFLSIFNIIVSQSRMGYLTLLFSIILLYLFYNKIYKKSIKSTLYILTTMTIISSYLYMLYNKGNVIVVQAINRWESLGNQIESGENRIRQINIALSNLDNPYKYLFGISRSGQNIISSFDIEVEPINILMLYGGLGLILQYGLILLLLLYFYKNIKYFNNNKIILTMIVASFVSLLSYQFFSFAYFFYRETVVGIFPWVLMGATIGMIEKGKSKS